MGAGTGELSRMLASRLPEVHGLDLWPRPPDWPKNSQWHRIDLKVFDRWEEYPVVFGNMIFHQFDADTLQSLGRKLAPHARLLVACEPARQRLSQWLFAALCPLIGANYVSRHDGRVSIHAGFLGNELPELLCLSPSTWQWRVSTTISGAYRLVAEKRP